jgi:putative hydrolase of HD superfamily
MIEDIEEFFDDISNLKHSERQGWIDAGVEPPRDTIASHSFGAALIGWVLAEKEEVDAEKVIKQALLHDMVMAHIPDVTPEDEEYEKKEEMEKDALEDLVSNIPKEIRSEARELIEEEVHGIETETGQVAKDADKLDTLLQAREYDKAVDEEMMENFIVHLDPDIRTDSGRDILEEVKREFHQ